MQDPDRKIRKDALMAWSDLYQSIADDLNDIYTKLINNRIKQAQVLGFKDYTEMMYLPWSDLIMTVKMLLATVR